MADAEAAVEAPPAEEAPAEAAPEPEAPKKPSGPVSRRFLVGDRSQ